MWCDKYTKKLNRICNEFSQTISFQEMMGAVNVDSDANEPRVDYPEFLTIMARMGPSTRENSSQVLDAFRVFDKDDTGVISASELKKIMTQFGMKLQDDEVEEIFRLSNCVDTSGQIKYKELIGMYF